MIHTGHIATVVRRLRDAQQPRMSREKMGAAAGLHPDTVKNVENGQDCTISTLFAMLDVLGISPVEFFLLCETEADVGP